MITLFTSNTCMKCILLKNRLKEENIEFIEKNISEDHKALALLISQGIKVVPVLFKDDIYYTNIEKIYEIIWG